MFLVTTSHSILKLEPDTGEVEPIHHGSGLYYGIATDGENYFVAARGRLVSSTVSPEEERGSVLVFDRSLRQTGEIFAPFPLRDMHEILWHAGNLWITCSYDNMLAVYRPASGEWERWYPLGETASAPLDLNHFNSIAVVRDAMYVIAHNFGASELFRFDRETRVLLSRTPFGMQSHNIRQCDDGALMTCSSAEGAVIDTAGRRIDVGGFPRGLWLGARGNYVGISEINERQDRDLSDGRLLVFDLAWKNPRTIDLRGEGLVLDVLPMIESLGVV